jgi:hypothetical protein
MQMKPISEAPKDGSKILMFFRAPTTWDLYAKEVYWSTDGGPPRWARSGAFGASPKYAVGWTPVPADPVS